MLLVVGCVLGLGLLCAALLAVFNVQLSLFLFIGVSLGAAPPFHGAVQPSEGEFMIESLSRAFRRQLTQRGSRYD